MSRIEQYRAVIVDEFPGLPVFEPGPEPSVMYVERAEPHLEPWLVAYHCPCGCGREAQLVLLQDGKRPRWSLELNGDIPTLSPSIQELTGCRSHYFIRGGKVVWA